MRSVIVFNRFYADLKISMLDTFAELKGTQDPRISGSERREEGDGAWKGQRVVVSRER
jgi:hypothetical protein